MSVDLDAAWNALPSADELPAEVTDEIGDVSKRIGFLPESRGCSQSPWQSGLSEPRLGPLSG